MWIMTKIGFYSIVEKPKGKICIRARCKDDLENLKAEFCYIGATDVAAEGTINKTPKADYLYRMVISRESFDKVFHVFAKFIDYVNFKDEVKKTNTKRERLYHQVWSLLTQIEREEKSG